jgi:hypothetical protein
LEIYLLSILKEGALDPQQEGALHPQQEGALDPQQEGALDPQTLDPQEGALLTRFPPEIKGLLILKKGLF